MSVDLDAVQRTMAALIERSGRPLAYQDRGTGAVVALTPEAAASTSGLLPALLVAGEAVWREVTGKGFDLDIQRDRDALLGYRLRGIGAGSFTTLMLATMEATAQASGPGALVVNELNAVWTAAAAAQPFGLGAARAASPAP